jgi:exodeoxyribonuclease III
LKYKMDFYEAFLDFAEPLRQEGKRLIICGDFNTAHQEIDLARPKENEKISGFLPVERAWMDKLVAHGYVDAFRYFNKEPDQYTWWDLKTKARERNVGWRIDYFFVTRNLLESLLKAYIIPGVTGSDHCPIGITIKTPA